jgi:hypothetical protein
MWMKLALRNLANAERLLAQFSGAAQICQANRKLVGRRTCAKFSPIIGTRQIPFLVCLNEKRWKAPHSKRFATFESTNLGEAFGVRRFPAL